MTTSFSHWHEVPWPCSWGVRFLIFSGSQMVSCIFISMKMSPGSFYSIKSELVYPIYIQFVAKVYSIHISSSILNLQFCSTEEPSCCPSRDSRAPEAPDSVAQAFLITKRWDAPQTFEEPGPYETRGGWDSMPFYGQQWSEMVNNNNGE